MQENNFKGILRDVTLTKLNTKTIKLALSRDVINEIDFYGEKFIFNNIAIRSQTWADFFCYNNKAYKLNSDIIDEIATIIMDVISKDNIEIFNLIREEVEIRKSIFSIKENNKLFKKKINKLISDLNNSGALFFIENEKFNNNLIKEHLISFISLDSNLIFEYLKGDNFETNLSGSETYKDLFEIILAHKELIFFKSCIDNKNTKKTTKKPSPLYQVLFIDCLRKVINEPYFSDYKIDEYLNIITKNNLYDVNFQKTRLKHLINMDKNKYDLLSGNKLGEIIKDITNTDISSLRKAAAVIKKPERERTLKQKKEFKNESLIRTEIHQIITELGNS